MSITLEVRLLSGKTATAEAALDEKVELETSGANRT